jgi:hypothetical protein
MKMSLRFVILILMSFIISCASTTPGEQVGTSHKDLNAYSKIVTELSDENIVMYQISLENLSREWIQLESSQVIAEIPEKLEDIEILYGEKLKAWIDARTLENNVDQYNTELALASIGLAGGVMAASSNQSSIQNAGMATLASSASLMAINSILEAKTFAEFQKQIPETHLLSKIVIPPLKVVQKWILIQYPYKKPANSRQLSFSKVPLEIKYKISRSNPEKFVNISVN